LLCGGQRAERLDLEQVFQFRDAIQHLFDQGNEFSMTALRQGRFQRLLFGKRVRLVNPRQQQRDGVLAGVPHRAGAGRVRNPLLV